MKKLAFILVGLIAVIYGLMWLHDKVRAYLIKSICAKAGVPYGANVEGIFAAFDTWTLYKASRGDWDLSPAAAGTDQSSEAGTTWTLGGET